MRYYRGSGNKPPKVEYNDSVWVDGEFNPEMTRFWESGRINDSFSFWEYFPLDYSKECKDEIFQRIYDELSERVGREISSGLSEETLNEFDAIWDGSEEQCLEMSARLSKKVLRRCQDITGAYNIKQLRKELWSRWININRPDYRTIVQKEMVTMKKELIEDWLGDRTKFFTLSPCGSWGYQDNPNWGLTSP